MLILAKAAMSIMLGFVISMVFGFFFVRFARKKKMGQNVSETIGERHMKKNGTPTMGGFIFIVPVLLSLFLLYIRGSIELSHNLLILIFVFVAYAVLGFADDYLKMKYKNNKGISIDMGWLFGIFILFVLVGTSNAVNITDGLDGLAGGLSAIAFLAFGIITWNTGWMQGYEEVAIFCFLLVGSLLGFLLYNTHPAKIFMGDLGSLALGGALATVAIITRHELSLVLVGGVFVVETISSFVQIIAITKFHKKIFKMAPLHHHFEQLGWAETDIVKLFWVIGFLLAMAAITYGVWI